MSRLAIRTPGTPFIRACHTLVRPLIFEVYALEARDSVASDNRVSLIYGVPK